MSHSPSLPKFEEDGPKGREGLTIFTEQNP